MQSQNHNPGALRLPTDHAYLCDVSHASALEDDGTEF